MKLVMTVICIVIAIPILAIIYIRNFGIPPSIEMGSDLDFVQEYADQLQTIVETHHCNRDMVNLAIEQLIASNNDYDEFTATRIGVGYSIEIDKACWVTIGTGLDSANFYDPIKRCWLLQGGRRGLVLTTLKLCEPSKYAIKPSILFWQ